MISYRNATPEDAPALAKLFATSFSETFSHLYRPEDLASFLNRFDEEGWRAELSDPGLSIRIVEAEGEAVGFGKIGTLMLPVEPEGPAMELRQLYLLKNWQGSGIAHELMRWALEEAGARGVGEVYLTVYVDNRRARRFYENYGFRFVKPYAFMVGSQADEDHILRLVMEDR